MGSVLLSFLCIKRRNAAVIRLIIVKIIIVISHLTQTAVDLAASAVRLSELIREKSS